MWLGEVKESKNVVVGDKKMSKVDRTNIVKIFVRPAVTMMYMRI